MKTHNISIWNCSITTLTPAQFDNIEVHPVCTTAEYGKTVCEKCEPKDAEFWSVYVQQSGYGFCIADCIDEATANSFAKLLRTIIDNWQIKVFLDIHEATIENIYTNHTLQVATADRDLFEADDNPNDLVRVTTYLPNAISGGFFDAIPIYDRECEEVSNELKRLKF